MSADLIVLLVLLLFVAAFVNGDFAITIAYLLIGAFLGGRIWIYQNTRSVRFERKMDQHAFWGETIPVRLKIKNSALLPVPWLQVYESLPVDLIAGKPIRQVLSLGPRAEVELEYKLHARKRGFYLIGPLFFSHGDMLGLLDVEQRQASADAITVYPRIIPLSKVSLPSRSPLGTLRHSQPIFEDPTRVLSKRDYVSGDSLRRVDWKASAASGRLQVKQFEPSIALEVSIFLNLNSEEYPQQSRIDSTELAIVIAASLANWVTTQKQSIGLVTNGVSTLEETIIQPIPPRKGQAHLIRVLEALAQVQSRKSLPLVELLQKQGPGLSWGTTIIIITGQADDALFDEIFQARRRGQNVVLIIAGRAARAQHIQQQAKFFNVPFYEFQNEDDLDLWRK